MFEFVKKIFSSDPFALYVKDNLIQVAQISGDSQGNKIESCGQRKLSEGIVKDGVVLNEKQLAKEIQTLLLEAKPNQIKGRNCYLALPERQMYEYIFCLPLGVKGDKIKESIDQLVAETIPIPFHQVKYDFTLQVHDKFQKVFVVAMKREVLAQYYEVLKYMCKLNPICFEPESLSIIRNINQDFSVDSGILSINIVGEYILWFLVWENTIFEGQVLSIVDFNENAKSFIDDLKSGVKIFEDKTHQRFSSIVISGDVNRATFLNNKLKEVFNVPVIVNNTYKSGDESFKIVCGVGLRAAGLANEAVINLLKK